MPPKAPTPKAAAKSPAAGAGGKKASPARGASPKKAAPGGGPGAKSPGPAGAAGAKKAPAGAGGARKASPGPKPGSKSPGPAAAAKGKTPAPTPKSASAAPSSAASAVGGDTASTPAAASAAAPTPVSSAPTPTTGDPTPIPGETPAVAVPSSAASGASAAAPAAGAGKLPPGGAAAPAASAANDPWANPKATTMRLLIAADEELIPDWKQKRIVAICPMNMPLKGFIERALKLKLNWENINDVVCLEAIGTDLSNIKPTGEVLETALTPHQLKIKPDSINWVWLRPKTDYDAPDRNSKELMLERLERFYHFHDPAKVGEAEAKLTNFEGQEELLFVKLVSQYGPEPSPEQVRRKMITPQQLAAQSAASKPASSRAATPAAAGNKPPGADAGGGSVSGSQAALNDFEAIANSMNLASVMSRTSDSLMFISYYKKWVQYAKTKRESRRVCAFMSGNMDVHLRKDYFQKWRVFFQTKKIKKQLQASTQMAYKSESLVGDLATENMFLKGEVKKLRAQVEVLDSANNKRLETLFSSSEAAIGQIQLLTRENQQKEELINKLESKLMNVGNLMLQANEDKDHVLQQTQEERVALDEEVTVLREKVRVLEEGLNSATRQIDDVRDRPPPKVDSFPEYQRIRHECDVHLSNHDKLRAKIEVLEKEKLATKEANKKQQAQTKTLQREVQSLQDEIAAMRHFGHQGVHSASIPPPPPDGRSSPLSDGGYVPPPPGPPPPEDDSDTSRPPSPERKMTVSVISSRPSDARGFERQPSPPPQAFSNNESFGVPPPHFQPQTTPEMIAQAQQGLADRYGQRPVQLGLGQSLEQQHVSQMQQPMMSNASFVTNDSHTQRWADPALQALRSQQQEMHHPQQAGAHHHQQQQQQQAPHEHQPPKVNISLDSFFDREERTSREKMKLYLDRHMQPRYETLERNAATNKSSIGTYYRLHQPAPAQPPPFVSPGGAGTVTGPEAPQQPDPVARYGADALMLQQQMQNDAIAARPKAEPRHSTYGTGEFSGTRREMKSSLFSFVPTSIK